MSEPRVQSANFMNAENLTNAQIKSACDWEKAIYAGTYDKEKWKFIVNEEENQKRIAELKEDKNSDPKVKPDCSTCK